MQSQISGPIAQMTPPPNAAGVRIPNWVPGSVHLYLAHTGAGLSIRDLARLQSCHASTVLRRIRRVEQQRDDPLVDAALRRIEARLETGTPGLQQDVKKEVKAMSIMTSDYDLPDKLTSFEQEAMRILRRLCETGAVMAIAKDMDMAVIVREGQDGSATRTAVVEQEIAQAMALRGWIETESKGRILRYRITSSGRDEVLSLLQRAKIDDPLPTPEGFAEAAVGFAHADPVDNDSPRDPDSSRRTRYNLAESPIVALSRRRDRSGTPFLSEDLVRCGERLREDFELAQMGPRLAQDWNEFLSKGIEDGPDPMQSGDLGPQAAKDRVLEALKELGPGLSDVALRCCCYLEGLESAEKKMGWSARSGKIVLRIALQRLKRHYDDALKGKAQMIG